MTEKPLGRKNYGSIPHLPGSRTGPGDHTCHEGQARIATEKARDRHDEIIVTEKLDGSNVGVALVNGKLHALGRAGYLAESSSHEQHRLFARWVEENAARFYRALCEGERLVGEWMAQAHGTRYDLSHEPFVLFDLMIEERRLLWEEIKWRAADGEFMTPAVLHEGGPLSIEDAMKILGECGYHGAIDPAEGAVWRIERDNLVDRHSGERERVVDYLVKYVRPDKIDGIYLDGDPVWNWRPYARA